MSDRFAGMSVLITGGSSGIGLATAEAFAAQGANVAVVARHPGRLEDAVARVEAARRTPQQVVSGLAADVADLEQVLDAAKRAAEECGPIDILVNNAGIYIPGDFMDLPLESFRATIDIDLLGMVYLTRAVAGPMIERGSGHIINISSMAGYVGVFGYTSYSAAKFGVMGFSEVLRSELKPHGVVVSVVCPPDVDTPGLAVERTLRPPETEKIAGTVKAVSPDFIAGWILKAAAGTKYLYMPGFTNAALYRLKGVWPELFFAVFDHDIASVRRNGQVRRDVR
ncbi:MAG: SDR family oxidoreductase [Actinomycetia bacterium]|nr:SDR family oxidoreductase [Actinomycetes bacterium]